MLRIRSLHTGVAGSPWYTNMYFNGNTQGNADAARLAVLNFWTALRPQMTSQVTTSVDASVPVVSDLTGAIDAFFTVAPFSIAGTATTAPLPYANQGLVTLNTAGVRNNRRVAGRLFIPGLVIGTVDTTNGTPATTFITAAQTAVNALIADPDSILQVWSRPLDISPPLGTGQAFSVTTGVVRDKFGVLRSRRD